MTPTFFATPAELRRWFKKNHASCRELWIGFYKKQSGRGGVDYRQALDEALCFGWIDGIIRRVDDLAYCHRFTPRTAQSPWSVVNVARAKELIDEGRMQPPGLAAFERRGDARRRASTTEERASAVLTPSQEKVLKANKEAWAFFSARPPSYRRNAAWWVQSAKQEATKARRLAALIESSAAGRLAPPFIEPQKKS